MDDYPVRSRGGLGVLNYYVEKNGPVAGIKSVDSTDEVFLISDDGVIIRISAAEIAVQSRYGGGVRVMRLAEGSKIVTLARAPAEEQSDEEVSEDPQEDPQEEAGSGSEEE